jgi:hypothetical protein
LPFFYVTASVLGIIGYFINSDILFTIGALSCFVLLTINFLIRGFTLDKIRAIAQPDREGYIIKLGLVSRIITTCVLFFSLYYFFPTITSWIVIVFCASMIFNKATKGAYM